MSQGICFKTRYVSSDKTLVRPALLYEAWPLSEVKTIKAIQGKENHRKNKKRDKIWNEILKQKVRVMQIS